MHPCTHTLTHLTLSPHVYTHTHTRTNSHTHTHHSLRPWCSQTSNHDNYRHSKHLLRCLYMRILSALDTMGTLCTWASQRPWALLEPLDIIGTTDTTGLTGIMCWHFVIPTWIRHRLKAIIVWSCVFVHVQPSICPWISFDEFLQINTWPMVASMGN